MFHICCQTVLFLGIGIYREQQGIEPETLYGLDSNQIL